MDISYPAETETFRTEVKEFLAEALPPDWQGIGALDEEAAWSFARDWRRLLAEHRYLSLTWPERYGGRGLSKLHQVVLMEELALAGVPFGLTTFGGVLSLFRRGQRGVSVRRRSGPTWRTSLNEKAGASASCAKLGSWHRPRAASPSSLGAM